MTRRLLQLRLYILAAIVPTLGSAHAVVSHPTDQQCSRLLFTRYPGLQILSATRAPAGTFAVGAGQGISVPASCRVVAVARPTEDSQIGFELWLPDSWNGRYSQLGNGGFAGNIDQPSLADEIRRGNAAAMTDTGHKAGQFDASWALGHPQKVVDYGYRSIKVTSDAAAWLIKDYYGRAARRRYFIGCSNGGRQALMAAQRYPDDWDGILAGSPAVQWTKQFATFAAIQHHLRASPENWIPVDELQAIQRAATAACPLNSRRGASPTDARQCHLDVRKLLCRNANGPDCLTASQAATLELIQSGPRSPRGELLYSGFEPGFAAIPDNWDRWILNADRSAPSQLAFATQAFRFLILDQPDWEVEQFDLANDFARASERKMAGQSLSAILDADNPDLSRFARRGGKLIMYLGSADAVISPRSGMTYYQRVIRRSGGAARVLAFSRLFVVPGMQHCQGGLTPDSFGQAWIAPGLSSNPRHDVRSALQDWVERGRPPNSLIAAKFQDDRRGGRLTATRELRPYPDPAGPISSSR